MKSRQEIKAIAKARFKEKYWLSVGVSAAIAATVIVVGAITGSIGTLIFTGPLTIGMRFFFIKLFMGEGGTVDAGTPYVKAFDNFGRKLGGSLWMELFSFLWSLLFVIPGIVKGYSYAMTPYILSDCPNVKAKDALKLSMRIMKGHKGELFVFELSFLGWLILDGLTCGILGIFYLNPYVSTSLAGYYLEVREEALRTGAVTIEQLNGEAAV